MTDFHDTVVRFTKIIVFRHKIFLPAFQGKLKALSDQADLEFTTTDDMGVKTYDAERASMAKALGAELLKANPAADWPTIWAQVRRRMGAATTRAAVPTDAKGKKDYRGMLQQYVGGGAAD
jgi:hypothetical protein